MQDPNSPYTSTTLPTTFVAQASPEARLNFIRKTYAVFTASLVVAIFGAAYALASGVAYSMLPYWKFALLGWFLVSLVAQWVSRVPVLNYVGLFGFTFLTGVVFAPLLALYESVAPGVVGQAGFLTLVIFGSLTGYAFVSKKDFSYLGGMLCMGLIALILGGLANLFFFHSSAMAYFSAWITLMLFGGFVLYDTSKIMYRYDENAYCTAAIALFLDFLNIFLALLRILGGSRR